MTNIMYDGILFILLAPLVTCHFNVSDDTLFDIQWMNNKEQLEHNSDDSMVVKTTNNEAFRCQFPKDVKRKHEISSRDDYRGPGSLELLAPLFQQKACSYKIESYWTYELCHGRHLRQYHEEQHLNKPVLQEYYLGYYPEQSEERPEGVTDKKPPTILLEGTQFPYFQVNFTNGLMCDLTGEPRWTSLLYICQSQGRGELYDITELGTCHYQAVVLTKLLCEHPDYQLAHTHVNDITCSPMDEYTNYVKPRGLTLLEEEAQAASSGASTLEGLFGESSSLGIQIEATRNKDTVVYRIKKVDKTVTGQRESEQPPSEPQDESESMSNRGTEGQHREDPPPPSKPEVDDRARREALMSFLSGDHCVEGGTGWWKHEFCYRKSAIQYHDDPNSGRTMVVLGLWNEELHRAWLQSYPNKKPTYPAEDRRDLWMFYGEGDMCDLTKRKRQTVVRIRCGEGNSIAVTILFQEPAACEYVITLESSIFCPLVQQADDFALPPSSITWT